MMQGGPAVEQLITNDMITQLNRQIDKAVFDTIIGTGDGDNVAQVSAAQMILGEAALIAAGVDFKNPHELSFFKDMAHSQFVVSYETLCKETLKTPLT